jgi:hypothetical protein
VQLYKNYNNGTMYVQTAAIRKWLLVESK